MYILADAAAAAAAAAAPAALGKPLALGRCTLHSAYCIHAHWLLLLLLLLLTSPVPLLLA